MGFAKVGLQTEVHTNWVVFLRILTPEKFHPISGENGNRCEGNSDIGHTDRSTGRKVRNDTVFKFVRQTFVLWGLEINLSQSI